MSNKLRKIPQGDGAQLLLGLTYPVWIAAIREPGDEHTTILMDNFGGGPGVLLLQTLKDREQFAQNCREATADGHPCEPAPVELGSLRELHAWMTGPAKAHGGHIIYLWEQVRGHLTRGGERH